LPRTSGCLDKLVEKDRDARFRNADEVMLCRACTSRPPANRGRQDQKLH